MAAKKVASPKVVRYIGTSDVRIINHEAWKNVNVEDQNQIVWDKSNRWEVSVEDLSESAIAYLTETDGETFVLVDATVPEE